MASVWHVILAAAAVSTLTCFSIVLRNFIWVSQMDLRLPSLYALALVFEFLIQVYSLSNTYTVFDGA